MESPDHAGVVAACSRDAFPGRNTLRFFDDCLAGLAVRAGLDAGIPVVLATDVEDLATRFAGHPDVRVVPAEFRAPRRALSQAGFDPDSTCPVILDPAAPFRGATLVRRCLEAHRRRPERTVKCGLRGRTVAGLGETGSTILSRCVEVLPAAPDDPWPVPPVIVESCVRSLISVDTYEDYAEACVAWIGDLAKPPLNAKTENRLVSALGAAGFGGDHVLVARPDGGEIPQDRPVAYLNRCLGYEGGRVDAVFVWGNSDELHYSKSPDCPMRECLGKASVVVVRRGPMSGEFAKANPFLKGKLVEVGMTGGMDYHHRASMGGLAQGFLGLVGGRTTRIGFSDIRGRIRKFSGKFHRVGLPYDVAVMSVFGRDRVGRHRTRRLLDRF